MAPTKIRKREAAPRAPRGNTGLAQAVLRLKNAVRAKTGTVMASPPARVAFELGSPEPSADALSLDEWSALIDEVPQGATLRLQGLGTLASPFMEPLLVLSGRRCLDVVVQTDGLALEDAAPALYGLGVARVELTLFGPEGIHNAALSSDDAFERAVRGALAVKRLACGDGRPELVARIPVSAANHTRIVDSVEGALAMGADQAVVTHTLSLSESAESAVDPAGLTAELAGARIRWRRDRLSLFPRLSLDEVTLLYTGAPHRVGSARCARPWKNITVDSRGNAFSCRSHVLGNVRDATLSSLHNSPVARSLRRELKFRPLAACANCLGRFGDRTAL